MSEQESFLRHMEKIDKKVATMEKKMNQSLQGQEARPLSNAAYA